ncbi:MAG TPA: hypothetical protein [Caudoviricetes sp.]|nr:MAG TPA: hypothetical protein [Caudoviricetes sp.]
MRKNVKIISWLRTRGAAPRHLHQSVSNFSLKKIGGGLI